MKSLILSGYLVATAALVVSMNVAAVSTANPWNIDETVPLEGATNDGSLRRQASIAEDGQVFIGLERRDECGQVQIYESENVVGGVSQVLSRADAGLSCERPDFFGSNIVRVGHRLLISAPNIRTTVVGEQVPSGEIFIYEQQNSANGELTRHWTFTQRIDGAELGLLGMGYQLASDGERIFTQNNGQRITPATFFRPALASIVSDGVAVLVPENDGSWQLQQRVRPQPVDSLPVRRFSVAGDQLVLEVFDRDASISSIIIMQESTDGAADWHQVQRIDETEFSNDVIERNGFLLLSTSSDYMALRVTRVIDPNEPGSFRASENELLILRRDGRGQWQFNQVINAANTEAVLGPVIGPVIIRFLDLRITRFRFKGADLIAGWLPTAEAPGSETPFRTVHYRLNEKGQFHPLQLINLPKPNGAATPDYVLDDEYLTVFRGFEAFDSYRRAEGSNFVVDRGLTGGWWFGPARNGQGVGLEILPNNRAQMVWVTHDNNGEQMWLFGGGDVSASRIRFNLAQPLGGRLNGNDTSALLTQNPWGEVELVFDNCEQGVLNYDSDTMGSGSLPLLRLTKVDGLDCGEATASELARRWTGSWFDPDRSGQGIMMHVTPTQQGPRLSTLWMTYQDDGSQASLYSAAPLQNLEQAIFNGVIRPTGPTFNSGAQGNEFQRNEWGVFGLVSTQCDSARLEYVSLDTRFGSGEQELMRFSTPLGASCL